jgi:PAS domain S-box-containing protein
MRDSWEPGMLADSDFREILDLLPEIAVLTDTGGKILHATSEFSAKFGYPTPECLGKFIDNLIVPVHLRQESSSIRTWVSAGHHLSIDSIRMRKDGSLFAVRIIGQRINLSAGGHCLFLMFRDLSGVTREESGIFEREFFFRETQRAGNIGTYKMDFVTGLWESSEVLDSIFGIGPDYNRTVEGWLRIVHPEDRETMKNYLANDILEKHMKFDRDYRIRRIQDEAERWVHGMGVLETDGNGDARSLIGTIQDVSELKESEELRRKTETRFRTVVDTMNEGFFITDEEAVFTFVNQALLTINGLSSAGEMVGSHVTRFLSAEAVREVERIYRETLTGQMHSVPPAVTDIVQPDGREVTIEIRPTPLFDKGKFIGFCGIVSDVTGRRRAEETVSRLHTAIENSGDIIFMTDTEGIITYVNPHFTKVYGYTPAEVVGLTTPRVLKSGKMHREDYEELWSAVLSRQAVIREMINKSKDGRLIIIEASLNPVLDSNRNISGFLAVQRDVTERKLVDERLRESEEKFRLISENVADYILVLDLGGRHVYSNASYRAVVGDTAEPSTSDPILDIHPDDRNRVREAFDETIRTGLGKQVEFRIVLPDGTTRLLEANASVIRSDAGEVVNVVVVSRDITVRKKIDEQALRVQRMESIGTLVGGIAHDLNNVFSPIMLSVGMLQKSDLGQQIRHAADIIESSAKRGSELIRQVLSFVRGVEGERTVLQVRHLVAEIENVISETFPRSIEIRTNMPKNLWLVSADPTQIHQVLMNLCVNARDAMPDGGRLTIGGENVSVDQDYVETRLETTPGPYVILSVTDTGSGMPPHIVQRIFEPFFTTKSFGKGTGLGLSTVQTIVKSHEGFINVYTEPGKGTTFRIYLPAAMSAESAEKAPEIRSLPVGNNELILVIDDEAALREIMTVTLESHDYRVLTAADGIDGLELFGRHASEIACVITDMMMPRMDGTAAIRSILQVRPEMKIIAISGLPTNESVALSLSPGRVSFLQKPYTPAHLLTHLKEILA